MKRNFVTNQVAQRIVITVAIVAYRALLDTSFILVLEPHFAYLGFVSDPSSLRLLASYLLLIPVAFLVPTTVQRPSDFLITIFAFIPVIPMLSIYGIQGGGGAYILCSIASFVIVAMPRFMPLIQFPVLNHGRKIALSIAVAFSIIVLIWFYIAGGFSLFSLDVTKVYDFRAESHARLSVGIFGYLNQWVFRVFNILLLSWALYRKNYFIFATLLALQVVYFGISSEKKVLFAPVLVLSVFFLSKMRYSSYFVLYGLLGVITSCSLVALLFEFTLPYSLFVRRIMFVPAQLNFVYYEYFSATNYVLLSNSILSFLFDYPFEDIPPKMISDHMFGHTEAWANTGLLGSSFMHFGYLGMIVYACIARIILHITDSLIVNRLPFWIGLSILIVPYFNLFTGADLTTALGTHGLGVGIVILWLYSSNTSESKTRIRKFSENES